MRMIINERSTCLTSGEDDYTLAKVRCIKQLARTLFDHAHVEGVAVRSHVFSILLDGRKENIDALIQYALDKLRHNLDWYTLKEEPGKWQWPKPRAVQAVTPSTNDRDKPEVQNTAARRKTQKERRFDGAVIFDCDLAFEEPSATPSGTEPFIHF